MILSIANYESGKREELASFWTRYERSIGVIIEGIDNKGRDYQNASRSIVRLVWFLDFVYEMVWYMRENPKVGIRSGNDMQDTLTTAVRYAYNKVLSPRHNALIRNAFKVAVIIIPSKATFLEKISNGHTPEEVDKLWIECETDMKTISDKFWTFFKSENMEELPLDVCETKYTMTTNTSQFLRRKSIIPLTHNHLKH